MRCSEDRWSRSSSRAHSRHSSAQIRLPAFSIERSGHALDAYTRPVAPYAFLFDADRLERGAIGGYRVPALRAFFGGVLQADARAEERFVLFHGDLMVHRLAQRTVSVDSIKTKHGSQTRHTETVDRDLWATFVWDFCDALAESWHTLDLVKLPRLLGRTNIYTLSASSLSSAVAQRVEERLGDLKGYLGAFCVDPGSPVHHRLIVRSLSTGPFYLNRSLRFDPWSTEDPENPPSLALGWYEGLPFSDVRYLTLEDDPAELPAWPSVEQLSPRGTRSLEIFEKRVRSTHLDRLAAAVQEEGRDGGDAEFAIDLSIMPRASDAVVEEQKLTGYVLDPDSGSGKAELFESALGITAADWRYLAAQLKEGLDSAQLVSKVRRTEYGIHYNVISAVKGRNGKLKPVLSAWEVRDGQPPRFITAYLARGGFETESLPEPAPHRVVTAPEGETRWTELWALATEAGDAAVEDTLPTPMLVSGPWGQEEGSEWVVGGAFGYADVAVADARRGFARWLVKNGRASTVRGRGAVLMAPPRQFDLSQAWADAFVDVLERNGIECESRSWLD